MGDSCEWVMRGIGEAGKWETRGNGSGGGMGEARESVSWVNG